MSNKKLGVDLAGLKLKNPTMNAAGVLGMSSSILKKIFDSGAGAVITKSLGPVPRKGHSNPTLIKLPYGAINAMGLPNPGVDYFIKEIDELKKTEVPIIASFFGGTIQEFANVAYKLSRAGVDALELNASCPNVADEMGMLAADVLNIEKVTSAVKDVTKIPVYVKLSPNVTDIVSIAKAAESGGADAITAVNTFKGLIIDINFKIPILANTTGGLSGRSVKPIALRCVWEIAQAVEIPIIGSGGVTSWKDAVEYLLAGASAVEIGTAIMTQGYSVFKNVNKGIEMYMEKNGFSNIEEIVGLAQI